MNSLVKPALLLLLSGAILAAMTHVGLLDWALLGHALQRSWPLVAGIAFLQAVQSFLLAARYRYLCGILGISMPLHTAVTATFVGNAVGQWCPGSIAVMEIVRFSVIRRGAQGDVSRATLIAGSLADRLLGFWGILALGGCASLWAWAEQPARALLLWLGLASLLGAVSILSVPWVASSSLAQRFPGLSSGAGGVGKLTRLRPDQMAWLASCSLLTTLLHCLGTWGAGEILGGGLGLVPVVAAFPPLALASLLPIGFGGLGGHQWVAQVVFQLFGLSSQLSSGASFLQNALLLVVSTVLAGLFARGVSWSAEPPGGGFSQMPEEQVAP